MTPNERSALEAARRACLGAVAAIDATLALPAGPALPGAPETFVSLKVAAAAWGIGEDAARKRAKRLASAHPGLASRRGASRWFVHRDALRDA